MCLLSVPGRIGAGGTGPHIPDVRVWIRMAITSSQADTRAAVSVRRVIEPEPEPEPETAAGLRDSHTEDMTRDGRPRHTLCLLA